MSPILPPIRGIASRVETLRSYSGLDERRVRVSLPETEQQLAAIFAHAMAKKHRVTFRAGGHSFDSQSLGSEIVVSMERFNGIRVLGNSVEVGPGATWGDILRELEPRGLVPAVTVTTSHATAGGTLSGDCLSRFSPAYGKEGGWIERFRLIPPAGPPLECTPPLSGVPWSQLTRAERAFCGAIGGLGYLGAVTSITYRLLEVGQTNGKIGVSTIVRKYPSCERLARELVPVTRRTYLEDSDPGDEAKHDALYSAVISRGWRGQRALFFASSFTTTPRRRRMALHRPKLWLRIPVEWMMRGRRLSRLIWAFSFGFMYRQHERFIDDLEGFTFFVDGNVRAKKVASFFGLELKTVQQTFVVPSGPGAGGGWDRARDDLVEWVEHAQDYLGARKLQPTLVDVLWLPKDLPFLLSATADAAGFAVSYAFETSDTNEIAAVQRALGELADEIWKTFQGRVYLVKNVCASPQTLAAMYGTNARRFSALKGELDPHRILCNEFLERTFPGLLCVGQTVCEQVGRD